VFYLVARTPLYDLRLIRVGRHFPDCTQSANRGNGFVKIGYAPVSIALFGSRRCRCIMKLTGIRMPDLVNWRRGSIPSRFSVQVIWHLTGFGHRNFAGRTSLRYHARMVSGCATVATSSEQPCDPGDANFAARSSSASLAIPVGPFSWAFRMRFLRQVFHFAPAVLGRTVP